MKNLKTVFIQPTFGCALNCKGCYVKESVQSGQMDADLIETLIRYLWIGTRYNIEQITIAVDDIPEDDYTANIMSSALQTALRLRSVYGKKIELHLTMNSVKTFDKYIDRNFGLRYIAENSDLISISHLTELDELRLEYLRSFTKINYNYMPGNDLNSYRKMLQHVDMSYYLLYKTGLGRLNDPRAIEKFKNGLEEIKQWSPEERSKIVVDGCVRDTAKYITSGFGCASNVSRIHVWPDGHVTGCPYNKDGGIPARNMTDVIDRIEATLGVYEFKSCSIPRDYFSKQPTLRVIQ